MTDAPKGHRCAVLVGPYLSGKTTLLEAMLHSSGSTARRGSVRDGKLIGIYLVDGIVRAAVGLDRGGDPELDLDGEMAACSRLVAARAHPAPAVLADERTDLWSLADAKAG